MPKKRETKLENHQQHIAQQIQEFFANLQTGDTGWESVFQILQSLTLQLTDEIEQSLRIQFLENSPLQLSVEKLLDSVSESLTRAQKINIKRPQTKTAGKNGRTK